VPLVQLLLQSVTLLQQAAVAGREIVDQRVDSAPERLHIQIRARESLVGNESIQYGGYLKPSARHVVSHLGTFFQLGDGVPPALRASGRID
jgi:hypothetical protein